MHQPQTHAICLLLMLISMLCWRSWANTLTLSPGFRFQLFYWDYAIGLLAGATAWGLTLGSNGATGRAFFADMAQADAHSILLAVFGGVIFNVANLLLVAAIDIAGVAVAFPVGIGLALVVGAVSSYALAPRGNPILLFGGIALVVSAIVFDALAYRLREVGRPAMSKRGIVVSLVAGILMGCFYPFVSRSMARNHAVGPYAAVLFFVLGVAVCAIPVNYLLMRKPLDGRAPVSMAGYVKAPRIWNLWGGCLEAQSGVLARSSTPSRLRPTSSVRQCRTPSDRARR